jgi:hypothetical protein
VFQVSHRDSECTSKKASLHESAAFLDWRNTSHEDELWLGNESSSMEKAETNTVMSGSQTYHKESSE